MIFRNRRCAFCFLMLLPVLSLAQRKVSDAEVQRVHRSMLIIDTHSDTTSRTVRGFDIGVLAPEGPGRSHMDLPRMKVGGLGAQFWAVYVASSYTRDNRSANRAMEMIDTVLHDIIGRYPASFELALTSADIERIHRKGKIASLMGIEGGHAIEDSLRLLRDFHRLGIRYMTLTHSNTNNWADSSGDVTSATVKHHNGLTDFGKEVVREMNRLGMMVDISHVADKTFYDAIETSQAPIFASHSSARALCNVPRNMTDEMIKALAKNGGVMQVNFSSGFLSQKVADASATRNPAIRAKLEELQRLYPNDPEKVREERNKLLGEGRPDRPKATLDDLVAHIDHVVKLVGVDYVGIGSDFDGVSALPEGMEDVSKLPNLTRALLERGYTATDIRKIYGGNLLRVMRQVEKVSAAARRSSTTGKPAGK